MANPWLTHGLPMAPWAPCMPWAPWQTMEPMEPWVSQGSLRVCISIDFLVTEVKKEGHGLHGLAMAQCAFIFPQTSL